MHPPVGTGTGQTGRVRDFNDTHPDFEKFLGSDRGIVEAQLGPDRKPVYARPSGGTATTTGKANFDQWYRDTPGVNVGLDYPIELTYIGGGIYSYANSNFFPIDDQLFGNQGRSHNYHFTFEFHSQFTYVGGEFFNLNNKLAIDLGGVHGAASAGVNLDNMAANLGITRGGTYDFDFFFAERHTVSSTLRMDTSLVLTQPVPTARWCRGEAARGVAIDCSLSQSIERT